MYPQAYVPDVMTGHVVPDITLQRIKERLSEVRGALVECPMVCFRISSSVEILLTILL